MLEHSSSATILEFRFWIKNPKGGLANIKFKALERVTELLLKAHDIPSQKLAIEGSLSMRTEDITTEEEKTEID